ncbi:hypothetical protein LQ757_16180 [Agromyces sp. SYSU K20354]|uniref:hypothetical protein n=1 Tax=Agromyces cavernae TaxID=2898659 RepID=UPI001E3B3CBD|nr:hypothetical protein [Agromyces cavernae]MCD2443819.1 hypothetical protein [Agromyces cavernae]
MTTANRRTVDRAGYPPPALTAAVLALFAIALAVCAVVVVGDTTARALASYTPVEAIVVDDRTEEALVADRRGSSQVPFRVAIVELPDGVRADVRSDDLVVGAPVTVYRSDSGAVFATPPARPGALEWALGAAIVAAAVVLAIVAVCSVLRLRS